MSEKVNEFIKTEILRIQNGKFVFTILSILIGYIAITFWLNGIRATAPLTFVWILIIIQFILYFAIFSTSYLRFKEIGFNFFGIIPFIVLSVLGRVENWEILIIPMLIISMLVLSFRNINKQTSNK